MIIITTTTTTTKCNFGEREQYDMKNGCSIFFSVIKFSFTPGWVS